MNKQDPYILWLPSWYPNRLEPYNGDFIQRHARAAAVYDHLHVIYIIKDVRGCVTKSYHEETFEDGQLKETIIYYYISPQKIKPLEKFLSFRKYVALYKHAIKNIIKCKGKPKLIHVYIAFKAGLIAIWANHKFKIPYIVSEQWTLYLPEAKPNFYDTPFYVQYFLRKIFKKARSVMVVSNYLGLHIQRLFSVGTPIQIDNVVDNNTFNYADDNDNGVNKFVHISSLNYQKNPEDIVKAFSIVKKKGYHFVLDIVGPEHKGLVDLVRQYELEANVRFHEEMPQYSLVQIIRNAKALILYSRYETFGCVLIEANACGVPVIVSDIPVIHENVRENFNGLIAQGEDPQDLSEKIIYLIKTEDAFNREMISKNTLEIYSFKAIGLEFHEWYNQTVA